MRKRYALLNMISFSLHRNFAQVEKLQRILLLPVPNSFQKSIVAFQYPFVLHTC